MHRKFHFAVWLCLLALALHVRPALAHAEITVGDYTIEIGWLDEPPVVGSQNAIVLHVERTSDGSPVEDVTGLTLALSYGGQEKLLALVAHKDEGPGHFLAPVIPTVPGEYTVLLGGRLGDTPVDAHMEPEEVQPADGEVSAPDPALAFPDPGAGPANAGSRNWLIYAGIAAAIVLLALGALRMRRVR